MFCSDKDSESDAHLPRHDARGIVGGIGAVGKYERITMRMFFFHEQWGFLNIFCADPGSNTRAWSWRWVDSVVMSVLMTC